MENRLRNLKNTMKKNVFPDLEFNEVSRNKIHKAINEVEDNNEDLYYAIFQILREEHSGFELQSRLRSRGITRFAEKEGSLYMLLHELEQKEYVRAVWLESEKKVYVLGDKGRKMIKQAEKKQHSGSFISQSILGGS
ncbi:PadR family transcriptional regulator [Peribacillus psychrosaccharolyticus]|uniref:PadR family transcriptional regulator n=1 Tax=Peribacillus psychrosaccharolyticus TaxID=1407 RepID=A0A974NKQ8_PERPY|nr:PadR family transcriptional regulator [Peribacillus psychrosaccharolyticus]MEC2054623.1 PadR family transcriptional regulator [Peribacillus psychrosaccharolyticus]MED3744150.1 PadR family transcriptional regulator [Peribacillus psychrosaccharolyticus]QQS99641.1 PadR family transcriptional regulator [Peribacillus psychrosaccharolyticus]